MTDFSDPNFGQQEEEEGFFEGIVKAPIRGVAGAAAGVANLFGADIQDNFGLGKSQGVASGFLEGLSQFLVGFVPVAGWIGRGGSILSKGAQAAATSKRAKFLIETGRAATAGAVADFAVFDGNDERLSNLIQDIPALANPLTEFLAASEDDSEVFGRLKNVVEGAGLGVITDGLLLMFRKMRSYNGKVAAGDTAGAAADQADLAEIAEEVYSTPRDSKDILDETLTDPEVETPKWHEEGLDSPEQATEAPQAPQGPQTYTKADVEKRLGADPLGGEIIVVNTPKTGEVMRGMSQFDHVVREPNSRLNLLQLDADAKILRNPGKVLKKKRGQSADSYRDALEAKARSMGYDAIQTRKGANYETTVLNEARIARRVNVESSRDFFDIKAEGQAIKRPEIVAKSPIEKVAHELNLSRKSAREFADGIEAMKKATTEAEVDNAKNKIRGLINLDKQGEKELRAYYKFMIEEIPWMTTKEASLTHEDFTSGGAKELGKMLGQDPETVAKDLTLSAGDVNKARSRAVGAQVLIRDTVSEIAKLAEAVTARGDIKLTEGTPEFLEHSRALEMFARRTEHFAILLESFGRLRRSAGQFLNSYGIGIDKLQESDLISAIRSRGGAKRILRSAQRVLMDAEVGASHLSAQLAKRTKSNSFWNAFTDWWMFSLLSAPKTQTTNIFGSSIAMLYRPIESAVGGWLGKKLLDPAQAQEFSRHIRTQNRKVSLMASMMREVGSYWAALGKAETSQFSDGSRRAIAAGRQAFAQNEGVLGRGASAMIDFARRSEGGITADNIGHMLGKKFDENSGIATAINAVGNITKKPGQLMVSTDEMMKQVAYQAHIRAELMEQAAERGLTDKAADAWVDNEVRKMSIRGQALTETNLRAEAERRYPGETFVDEAVRQEHIDKWIQEKLADGEVYNRSEIAMKAMDYAKEVTFTKELDPKRGALSRLGGLLQEFSAAHPAMVMFTPFIRTPMNILMFTAERLPIPYLNKDFVPMLQHVYSQVRHLGSSGPLRDAHNRFTQQLTSSDPAVAADAMGRAATTLGAASVFGMAAAGGLITGGGPKDPDQAKVLRASGWQPYSIKVGDTYVSYQRLDPLAGLLAFFGDFADVTRYSRDPATVEKLAWNYLTATVKNLESKSYLAGVMDLINLIHDPEKYSERLGGRIAGNLVVPNAIAAMRGFTDDYMAEVNGVMDHVIRRIPFLNDNGLEHQRNVLGEPIRKKQLASGLSEAEGFAGYILPVMVNQTSSDLVTNELTSLAYPFTAPEPQRLGVDLRDYRNAQGQSAYDRWQELTGEVSVRGRKLRPALERLIRSNEYRSLPVESLAQMDLDSPRVVMINSLVGRYRRAAEKAMLKEFPDLQRQTLLRADIRERLRRGEQPDALQQLLNQ